LKFGPSHKARRFPNSRFSLYGVKFWTDGSNQLETAAQTKPYLTTQSRGAETYTASQMKDICQKAKAGGWTILAHCQGDASLDDYLNAMEATYGAHPKSGLNRVEHATMARQDQIDRMKRLGCEPTFMPDFLYLYGNAYRDTLFGPERAAFMIPFGAAQKAGIGFSLHSDNPAAGMPMNPLRLVEIAVTRRCVIDNSIIGPDLRLTVDAALRAVTQHAARHLGLGDAIGTLENGKEADLVILESDPYTVAPDAISKIKVSETWLAGEKKFG
jgi:predicted amidohydrolase YtcJ